MQDFIGYYWQVIKTAFTESWDISQTLLSVANFIISILTSYYVGARKISDFVTMWQFYGILFCGVIVIRIISAPYILWLEQRRKYENDITISEEQKRANEIAEANLRAQEDNLDMQQCRDARDNLARIGCAGGAVRFKKPRNRYTKRE